jgi:nitrate reductase gamma subunit
LTGFLLWVALPYASIAVFILGHALRWRHDRFGWTDEWVRLFKPRYVRWSIVLFHGSALAVIGGHVVGIIVPSEVTAAAGVSESLYRAIAITLGGIFGIGVLVGLGGLLYRRTMIEVIVKNNQPLDLLTLSLIAVVVLLGMVETLGVNLLFGGYDYRSTVAVWFRGLLLLSPQPGLMASVPLPYQLHAISAWLLFAIWPFGRLVHAWQLPFWAARRLRAARSSDSIAAGS